MVIGLTGGIGCGKSTVARIFQQLGCAYFDSDTVVKQINNDVKDQLIKLFGPDAFLENGTLNRKLVSDVMFNNDEIRQQVNDIYIPLIQQKFNQFKNTTKAKVIIYETALLFEANQQHTVDKIITVDAPEAVRISRVLLRNPEMTSQEIQQRIKAQFPQHDKIQKSDFVIHNNSLENLNTQVIDIYNQLIHSQQ